MIVNNPAKQNAMNAGSISEQNAMTSDSGAASRLIFKPPAIKSRRPIKDAATANVTSSPHSFAIRIRTLNVRPVAKATMGVNARDEPLRGRALRRLTVV